MYLAKFFFRQQDRVRSPETTKFIQLKKTFDVYQEEMRFYKEGMQLMKLTPYIPNWPRGIIQVLILVSNCICSNVLPGWGS